jgi:addiction module HigA family antidote
MTREVFAPGEYISEELEARGWTQDDLARILGRSLPAVNKIISGKAPLTPEIAAEVGAALGTSAEVWLNLEAAYRLARSNRPNKDIRRRARLSSSAPAKSMQMIRMAQRSGFRPGQSAPHSGQYQQIGPRGGKGREVTAVKGEVLPPTTAKGSTYKLVDPSKNKPGGR